MRIIDIEDAKKMFGNSIQPGILDIEYGYESYLHTDKSKVTTHKIGTYKINIVDNSEYDHGNGD